MSSVQVLVGRCCGIDSDVVGRFKVFSRVGEKLLDVCVKVVDFLVSCVG